MKVMVFWVVMSYSLVEKKQACHLLLLVSWLGLFFNPEDGGDTLLQNVKLSPNYTVL
jgi:hypothetical protein